MNMSFTILLSVVCLASLPTSITGCSSSDTLNATDTWQMISSSNYPNNYQNNENHCWNIISSVDNLIFEVISYDLETDHDYLRIYDVSEDLFTTEMARFTGNGAGKEQRTLTAGIRVEFTSDESGTGAGFQLRFKSYTSASDDDQDNFLQKNGAGAERGVSAEVRSTTTDLLAYTYFQYFSSPGFSTSSSYPNNEECFWLINSDLTTGITLARIFIDTQPGIDKVSLYDGTSISATKFAEWSGRFDDIVILSVPRNNLLVGFLSGTSNGLTYSGFQFGYKINTYQGTTTLTPNSDYESIYSPGYGHSGYSNNELLYWIITSNHTTGITLARYFLDTEPIQDTVSVYDGPMTTNNRIAVWSGRYETSQTIYLDSSGNHLLVEFKSDASWNDYGGFRLGYKLSSSSASIFSSTYNNSLLSATAIAGIVFGVLISHIQH